MDWLRRNWPDLIIGVALIAVIAGIVATLLSGGSFLSFGGQQLGNGNRAESPPAVQDSQPEDAEQNAGQASGQNDESATDTANNSTGANNQQESGIEPVIPDQPGSEAGADTPDNTAGDGDTSASEQTSSQETSTQDTEASEQTAATSAESENTSPAAGETGGVTYRISVGAFASREGAQSLTETYSDEGLPTFVASQGDLSLALVGPYNSEEEANRVAQQIIEGGGEAIVYTYEPEADDSASSASASDDSGSAQSDSGEASTDAAQSDSAASQAPTQEDAGATASADTAPTDDTPLSGTFLQAGAFGSVESAQPTRERIEELGYRTAERDTGTGLIRLFVGPLGEGEIDEAQTRLQALGIDNFPVSIP